MLVVAQRRVGQVGILDRVPADAKAVDRRHSDSYRMERPVIRAGIAPAEDPSLFTAQSCYRNPRTGSPADHGLTAAVMRTRRAGDDAGQIEIRSTIFRVTFRRRRS